MLVAAVLIALQFVVFSRTQIGRKLRATTAGPRDGAGDRHPGAADDRHHLRHRGVACRRRRRAARQPVFRVADRRRHPHRVRLYGGGDRRLGQHPRRGRRRHDDRAVPGRGRLVHVLHGGDDPALRRRCCGSSSCGRRGCSANPCGAGPDAVPLGASRIKLPALALQSRGRLSSLAPCGGADRARSPTRCSYASLYDLRFLTLVCIYAIMVLGFQFIFGHVGAVSLAQSTFFGLGGYVTGIVGVAFGLDTAILLPLSIAAAVLLAVADRHSGAQAGGSLLLARDARDRARRAARRGELGDADRRPERLFRHSRRFAFLGFPVEGRLNVFLFVWVCAGRRDADRGAHPQQPVWLLVQPRAREPACRVLARHRRRPDAARRLPAERGLRRLRPAR